MKVVEIFNSIDGEGIRAGELTTFIRLYGCNLNCSYCDTRYACEQQEENLPYEEMAIEEILAECSKYPTSNITVTGGEPLIHKDIMYLLEALSDEGYNVNVETNGNVGISQYFKNKSNYDNDEIIPANAVIKTHLAPADKYKNVWFTVDYKSPSSGMELKMNHDNFKKRHENIVYKFVVGSKEDLAKAYEIIVNEIIPDNKKEYNNYIYLSPIFGQIEPAEIVEFMQKNNMFSTIIPIRVQLQIHKFIWPVDKRGV